MSEGLSELRTKRARGRLTPEQVLEIRSLPRPLGRGPGIDPNSLTALAKRYGVSKTAISEARSGNTWSDAQIKAGQHRPSPRVRTGRPRVVGQASVLDCEVRPIPGFEGRYAVTSDGRVWGYAVPGARLGDRWVRPILVHGYPRVNLSVNMKRTQVPVHRAVALAWVPNPRGAPQVNHIDGDKLNNRAENLEWVTAGENVRHAWANGLSAVTDRGREAARRTGLKFKKLSDEQEAAVASARLAGATRKALAEQYGCSTTTIGIAIRKHRSRP